MRESRTSRSVRGGRGNPVPYRYRVGYALPRSSRNLTTRQPMRHSNV